MPSVLFTMKIEPEQLDRFRAEAARMDTSVAELLRSGAEALIQDRKRRHEQFMARVRQRLRRAMEANQRRAKRR